MTYFTRFNALTTRLMPGKALKNMACSKDDWSRDPLSHPDLQAMSERELADLPFDPGTIVSE
ncbi:MAG: hypothetical protein ACSHYC_09055 [Alphaproteobacteria bacterium]